MMHHASVMQKARQNARRAAVISTPDLGVLAVAAAGVLYAFCCVVDTLPEQCLCRRPRANRLVAAVFRTKRLLREHCSATCPRRRRPGQVRHTQGGLQITADLARRETRAAPARGDAHRSIDRSVLLFQAVLRRLARPTAVAPVPSIAAAKDARFSKQEKERGGRDGTITSPAPG